VPKDVTAQDLNNLYGQARRARARLEPNWYLNLAFYGNEQWLAWDGRQLFRPPIPRSRVLLVDNRIQPIIRKEIARMSKMRPVFTVTPVSADQEDTNAAVLGEEIMRYLWRHLNMQRKRIRALLWSRICGAGFLKCYWDPTIGPQRDVVLRPDGQMLLNGQGGPVRAGSPEHMLADSMAPGELRQRTVAQGDIRVEVRSPFQMYVDPLCDNFDEAEWLIEESIKSPEFIEKRYGVAVKPDTAANPGLIEARMGGTGLVPGGGTYQGVRVREYWCRPNKDHPQGCRKVWVLSTIGKKLASQLLEVDEKPSDPMPYVMFSGIPMPGRLMPMAVVDALRGPQTELNKVESQLAENRNRVGNPKLLVSRQAVQDPDKFAEEHAKPGGIYWYDDVGSPNAKPDVLPAPAMPEYVTDQIPLIVQALQEISGQHEVSSAQVPPGVTAASAINLLMEADDTMLAPDVADHEEELSKLGCKLLELVSKFYTDARTIQIGGDNASWQIFDFRGSMLRDNLHVEVQAGSAFPQSKSAKQAAMQDLLTFFVQSGNPPHGRQLAQFLQDWEVGGADRLIEEYTVQEQAANRENVLMSQGVPQPLNPYDKDEEHIANHEDFENAARFKQLPQPIQQLHLAHTQAHRDRLAQQQQQQMQQQMMLQGQPPPDQQQAQGQLQLAGMQQDQQQQQMQGQQQLAQAGQQQGYQAAQAEQQQRHAQTEHEQRVRHAQERHDLQQQLARQQQRGVPSGR
jgi:hypothetical protein